jgi:hypothetical protein
MTVEYDPILRMWFERTFDNHAWIETPTGGQTMHPYFREWVERWNKGPDSFFGAMDENSYTQWRELLHEKSGGLF